MSASTNPRDIPVRQEDVKETTTAVEALDPGGAGLATAPNQVLQITEETAVKVALEAGGYSGSRLNTISNSLTSGGYVASRMEALVQALTATGAYTVLANILLALGSTGANFIKTAVDAVATVLGPAGSVGILLTHIDSLLDTGGATLNAINQITTTVARDQTVSQVPFTWTTRASNVEFDIVGIPEEARYKVVCVEWASGDDATAAAEVQIAIGYESGGVPGASRYEVYQSDLKTFAANIAGDTDPLLAPRPFLANAAQKFYGKAYSDAGTTSGSGIIYITRTL